MYKYQRLHLYFCILVGFLLAVGCNGVSNTAPAPTQVSLSSTIIKPTSTTPPLNTPRPEETKAIPTQEITEPEALIATTAIYEQGSNKEFHEVWLINTMSDKKTLIFTTSEGTNFTTLNWGTGDSNSLYIGEIKLTSAGGVLWQFYEFNYVTSNLKSLFNSPIEIQGIPVAIDISANNKWLRVEIREITYLTVSENWFVNLETGEIVKTTLLFPGFVWSPSSPDDFAYSRSTFKTGKPQAVILNQLPNLKQEEIIEYKSTDWGDIPLMAWSYSDPNTIFYSILDTIYSVDLIKKEWIKIGENSDLPPGGGSNSLLLSPSGKWLINTSNIRVLQKIDNNALKFQLIERFDQNIFLNWYSSNNWMITLHNNNAIRIYELENEISLIKEIKLQNYGITPVKGVLIAQELR